MTPIRQSKLYCADGIHNGNCYAACLASLLDLPLWMVPPFEDMFGRGDWKSRTEQWLKRMFGLEMVRTEGHEASALPEFYIANGPAKRGVHHSVIYRRGSLVHDPHPAQDGLLEVEWCWHLQSVAPPCAICSTDHGIDEPHTQPVEIPEPGAGER